MVTETAGRIECRARLGGGTKQKTFEPQVVVFNVFPPIQAASKTTQIERRMLLVCIYRVN